MSDLTQAVWAAVRRGPEGEWVDLRTTRTTREKCFAAALEAHKDDLRHSRAWADRNPIESYALFILTRQEDTL